MYWILIAIIYVCNLVVWCLFEKGSRLQCSVVKCHCISSSDCAYLVFPSEPDKEDREKIDSDSSPSSTSDSDEEDCEPAARCVRKPLSGDKVPVKRGWYLFYKLYLIDLTS